MQQELLDNLLLLAEQAAEQYYRLVLIIGPTTTGKTALLQQIQAETGACLMNVNLELSNRLLDLSAKRRKFEAGAILSALVVGEQAEAVLLDNIEILFEPALALDPLALFKQLSRNRTIIAAWPGNLQEQRLIYAEPAHPEYQSYHATDFLFLELKPDE